MLRNHQLGFSLDASGRSFQSWLYVEEDGAIVVVEHSSFLGQRAREETKPGYSDHLFIPASYFVLTPMYNWLMRLFGEAFQIFM